MPLRPCHLAVLAAAFCAQASAQQAPDTVQQVEVKGSGYDARRDDTAARIVVGREEIARYGDTDVAEIFRRIPGVTVTTGQGRSFEVRMRGLGAGYTQILVNGERSPPGFALDSLSPESIERIEVLRVATAEFSTEAVAGTINIVLRRTARKRQREAKLGYLQSSIFRGPTFSAELGDSGERSSWSFSASGNHDKFTRESNGIEESTSPGGELTSYRTTVTPEDGRMNRLNLSPRLNWTLDNGDKLAWETLATSSSFRNNPHPVVSTLVGSPPPVPDLYGFGEFDDRMLTSNLSWTRETPEGLKLDSKFGFEWSSRKMYVRRLGFDSAGLPETDGHTLSDTHSRGLNTTGKATRAVEGGHLLALGWDLRYNESGNIRTERDRVRVFAPGVLLDEDFHAAVSRTALYLQDEWTVSPRLSVYMGARWEGVRTRVSGTAVEPARVRSSVLSPVAQVLYKFAGADGKADGDQLRFALSRTYKAPELDSIVPLRGEFENNSPTEADFQGNPGLKPELAWGLDAAYEHYWAEGAMVSISGAVKRIRDYTSNRVYFDGLRWIFSPVNDGRATLRSLDIETKFPLKAILQDAPNLELRASVSRNWSRVEAVPGPHNRMEQQTPLTANLGVDYKQGALSTGASLAHRRGGFVRAASNRGFYRDGRTDLDTYAVWAFNPKRQLRVALSNLLGEDTVIEPSYVDASTGVEKRRWMFPDGPKLRATLEMKF
ncbi:MAG: TonB-dependent receptor [Pseudomonadota bacterium]